MHDYVDDVFSCQMHSVARKIDTSWLSAIQFRGPPFWGLCMLVLILGNCFQNVCVFKNIVALSWPIYSLVTGSSHMMIQERCF